LGTSLTGNVNDRDKIGTKKNREAGGREVPLSAYLGMGPIHFSGKYTKRRILPEQKFTFSITYPKTDEAILVDALSLFAEFGALGARSRNGWGNFKLISESGKTQLLSRQELYDKYGEDIGSIFEIDKKYPFKLGKSQAKPLFWRIGTDNRWEKAMKRAGESYMDLRQQKALLFPKTKTKDVQARHILGYPITNHLLWDWGGKNGRMPSQLRIIIRKYDVQYHAYFFHLPHKIPKPWNAKLGSELSVWREIHKYLDKNFERTM